MNRNLLVAGGLILITGGLAYWYLLQQNGDGNGNGEPPTPQEGCGGPCYYPGSTACDKLGNLCKCVDGKYVLLEENSSECDDYHYECWRSDSKIVTCIPVPGTSSDYCSKPLFSKGCYCNPPNWLCDELHYCDTRVLRCMEKKTIAINANNNNWDSCENNPKCSGNGMRCTYSFEEIAANNLTGTFHWEWGYWGVTLTVKIYGYCEGAGWSYLGQSSTEMWGDEGSFVITLPQFASQGISKLRFECCADFPFVNPKPKAFYGTLAHLGA